MRDIVAAQASISLQDAYIILAKDVTYHDKYVHVTSSFPRLRLLLDVRTAGLSPPAAPAGPTPRLLSIAIQLASSRKRHLRRHLHASAAALSRFYPPRPTTTQNSGN